MADTKEGPLYLGLDFSTQQIKVTVIDESLNILTEFDKCGIKFDDDLNYNTTGGVLAHEDGYTVTAPTIMWVEGLDRTLDKLRAANFPFERVVGISASGQQHGSVYWRKGSEELLKCLNPSQSLANQLQSTFSISQSPVWMDSSTSAQCHHLEEACGGPLVVTKRTGSRAYERFTGNQIAKLNTIDPINIKDTERISLVSSFGVTLFAGNYVPIDYSDGSGMNLLDIQTKRWWQEALDVCCPNLKDLLGEPVPSNTVTSIISNYYVKRYGFDSNCKIVAATGDNPSSLAGMRLQEGDVVVSLGSSDTLFLWIAEANPQLMGHVFVNPVDSSAYMALLCYKNASLTRERIRNESANGDWEVFDEMLSDTNPGNEGCIGFYYDSPEITPPVKEGVYRFTADNTRVESFTPRQEVRAIVEGQFLAKYVHAASLGYRITSSSRILATGGGAVNRQILQILANVFNASVYSGATNSASLGAAYRAKHALMGPDSLFSDAVSLAPPYTLEVEPQSGVHDKVYKPMIERVSSLLSTLPTFQ